MRSSRATACVKCGTTEKRLARRLCPACYMREYYYGRIDDFPMVLYRGTSLIEAADELLSFGIPNDVVAERLGVKWGTIVTARWRLRRQAQREEENSEANRESD